MDETLAMSKHNWVCFCVHNEPQCKDCGIYKNGNLSRLPCPPWDTKTSKEGVSELEMALTLVEQTIEQWNPETSRRAAIILRTVMQKILLRSEK